MISTDSFLASIQKETKEDWRYNQLPCWAKDYIDAQYLQIKEIIKEEKNILKAFEEFKIPVNKYNEDALRDKFLEELTSQLLIQVEEIIDNATEYFNKGFGLAVSSYRIKKNFLFYKEGILWQEKTNFLRAYYELGDIKDINEAGNKKIKDDFFDIVHIGYNEKKFRGKISKNKIRFEGIIRYTSYWNNYRVEYDGKPRVRDFFKALEWFENRDGGNNLINCFFEDENAEIPSFEKKELNENFYEKIRGFRPYKNGSIDVYFSSDATKEEFIKIFNLKIKD